MTKATEEILNRALQLDPVERADLIDRLIRSFDPPGNDEVDARWAEEAERRIDAYEAGKLTADDEDAVFKRLNER